MPPDDLALSILDLGYDGPDKRLESRLAFTLSLARMAVSCPHGWIPAFAGMTRIGPDGRAWATLDESSRKIYRQIAGNVI